ncbi:hypothetical protein [Ralstonia flaminis]|jgi:hypothetical protein|uniref:Uncharacterized protein n=1 Tax=Ralstonia flaminis TaxID=3058597 RepID=A0ABM9KCR3_9RALS|nr:hypothetical protein [Ralstonia sp. LMG 18101]CAJ0822251.1 hypothetical protein LMG18101_04912 [Ralstonia sp. LMG 18101]
MATKRTATAKKGTRAATGKQSRKKSASQNTPKSVRTQAISRVPKDSLPRRTLLQALRVPEVIHKVYAGKSASTADICSALEIGERSPNTFYLFSAAVAYGLVSKEENNYSLTETGRKILAPTYDGEDREAMLKALLTPTILSQFYTDYNGHAVPSSVHFPNVLENRFSVPRDRIDETIKLILENARDVGIIVNAPDSTEPIVKLPGTPASVGATAGWTEGIASVSAATEAQQEDWDKVCFYITPIGEEGTEVRRHADMLLRHLVEPVISTAGLKVVRADKIEKAGLITQQIYVNLVRARLCIADLSFSNPNAFYELGIRHMSKRPTVQIIRKGDRIPFDVSQGRTIMVDTSDVYTVMERIESARRELGEHVKHILAAPNDRPSEDNPVETYLPGLKVSLPA